MTRPTSLSTSLRLGGLTSAWVTLSSISLGQVVKETPMKTCVRLFGILAERLNATNAMTLSELTRLATLHKMTKYPNVPIHALPPVKPFKDGTANELTRAIETFVRLTGNYADRINNTGIYDAKRGQWRKGGTRKGIADIMAAKRVEHQGRTFSITVAIEVKVGRDKMSPHQLRCKDEVEKAGGVYIIARNWDQFFQEWNAIK